MNLYKIVMKKYLSALALIITGLLQSCEKEIMNYEGVEGIYFAVQHGDSWGSERTWPYQPYTAIEFIKIPQNELTVNIKVMITGPTKDYDRPFRIEINPDSTTASVGVDFAPLPTEVVIPAHSISTLVPIKLTRTSDLKKKQKTIGLRLVANEYFQLSFPHWQALPSNTSGNVVRSFDASLHSIRVNDFMVKPAVWPGSVQQPGNRESGQWGDFSQKKIDLMCELMDLTYTDFSSTETMPSILTGLIASTCAQYLVEQFDMGTPILEDDGRLMFIGNVPWTSYLGVPYVPKP